MQDTRPIFGIFAMWVLEVLIFRPRGGGGGSGPPPSQDTRLERGGDFN